MSDESTTPAPAEEGQTQGSMTDKAWEASANPPASEPAANAEEAKQVADETTAAPAAKSTTRKSTTKKTTGSRRPSPNARGGKKSTAKKTTAKKTTAKKSTAKKTTASSGSRKVRTDNPRPRGGLELDVKAITDEFTKGKIALDKGKHLTPHLIARFIGERDGVEAPSSGAVSNIVRKWGEIGFAKVTESPLAFVQYTAAGNKQGLDTMKEKARAKAKAGK